MIKQDLERYLSNNGNEILELLLHEHLYENREMPVTILPNQKFML
jgi:hypothetical protein